jgi:hypothetical protein
MCDRSALSPSRRGGAVAGWLVGASASGWLVAATKDDVEFYKKFGFDCYSKTDSAKSSIRCHLQLSGYSIKGLERATDPADEGGWEWGGRTCNSGGEALMMQLPPDRKFV